MPVQLQRAMATEAEAAREARAKVIAAEGEQKASKALKEAADVITQSPIAIQLRYLQTLTQIASEKNSTIVFPVKIQLLNINMLAFFDPYASCGVNYRTVQPQNELYSSVNQNFSPNKKCKSPKKIKISHVSIL